MKTARTVKPEQIKTLRDWTLRWPKATNLSFDAETREPSVYSADASRTLVKSFPWNREGDTMTILSDPTQFSATAVSAARQRYSKIREQQQQLTTGGEDQLRIAEAALLEAWQAYNAASPAVRPSLRQDILAHEKTVRDLEVSLRPRDRVARLLDGYSATYEPPIPIERRGISLVAAANASNP
jgi:hypothetical protein